MSNRVDYIDTAKFIGLVLVCFCHIPNPEGNFHIWVYSFHMPLFFLLSGVFFSPQKFSVRKSAMQLFVPFVLFNIISLGISIFVSSLSSGHLKLQHIEIYNILHGSYPIGPSWFLLSLCIIRVYSGLILKYFNNLILVGISIILLVIFYFTGSGTLWSILSIGSSVLGLPFYLLGYYLKDIIVDSRHFNKWYVLISTLVLSILAIYNNQVGIHASQYGNNILLFLIFGIIGSIAVISLSTWIKIPRRFLDVFMDGALFFICMHTLIFEYLILIWNKSTGDFSGNTLAEKVVFTILTFAVSFPIILVLLKYTPFLLGKHRMKNKVK